MSSPTVRDQSRLERSSKSWRHALAFTTAGLTLLMIAFGATVTTIEAGDSDPTWSLLRPWEWFRSAQGGLWYELMHRRIGTVIGLVAIGLVLSLWRSEPRRWVRRLGYFAFGMIVFQGLLGGLRIHVVSTGAVRDWVIGVTGLDHAGVRMAVAMIHAFTAQLVFCIVVLVTLVTSRGWCESEVATAVSDTTAKTRRLCLWTCVLIFLQLVLGAYVRHGREIYPNEAAPGHDAILIAHVALALGVVGHVFWTNTHTRVSHPKSFPIWHLAGLAKFLVLLQLFLGGSSWLVTRSGEWTPPWDVAMLVRVGHVANGAMIFAIFVTITARAYRLLRKPTRDATPAGLANGAHA